MTTTGQGAGQRGIEEAIERVETFLDARPNILMIMVDQLYFPNDRYGSAGFAEGIRHILNFMGNIDPETNPWVRHYPGFCKLREYATVFADHTIAESACTPSRAAIMTGQYGPRTGVTQTDGLFKSGEARNFPWLRFDGTPTAGDWFREIGYSTHYFGKWHVSEPPEHTLEAFGFGDWELSWPEPHGALLNNMGTFRDYQFTDLACTFLRARAIGVPYDRATSQQAMDAPRDPRQPRTKPFFAVCSLTNPHDIATYPALPRALMPTYLPPFDHHPRPPIVGAGGSVPIPPQHTVSALPVDGTYRVPLNPTGLPQHCATAAPTQNEVLPENNKPTVQYEASIKVGIGLSAKTGAAIGQALGGTPEEILEKSVKATLSIALPFQLQSDPEAAAVGFLQYYAYMISMVDRHLLRLLTTLDETGLRENTVVVFAADHGEYGAAHGMQIEKWHGAYQEALHVPFLISSPKLNPDRFIPRVVTAQTSHIDILPTLLKLALASDDQLERARSRLSKTHLAAPLPGASLMPLFRNPDGPVIGPDGVERKGVMFVTDDMISEPLPHDDDPHNIASWSQYEVYKATVDVVRAMPPGENPWHKYLHTLQPGAIVQPAHVRALRSGGWKLVRYCDPWSERPVPDQWELYNLEHDAIENINLLVFDGIFPTPIAQTPDWTSREEVARKAMELREELRRQEATLLSPYPSAYPSAGVEAG